METGAQDWVPLRPGLLERSGDGVRLLGSRCGQCGTTYFPALAVCARCATDQHVQPARLSRRGTVYTYTVVRQSTPGFSVPYVLAYVDLPEQVRVLGQLEGVEPERVRTGQPVEVVEHVVSRNEQGQEVVGFRFRAVDEA